jgi:hypothetical protein
MERPSPRRSLAIQTIRHLEGVSIIASVVFTRLRDVELVAVDALRGTAYEGEIDVTGKEIGSGGGPAPLGGGAPATETQLLVAGPTKD